MLQTNAMRSNNTLDIANPAAYKHDGNTSIINERRGSNLFMPSKRGAFHTKSNHRTIERRIAVYPSILI